jgi:hypothetical protein
MFPQQIIQELLSVAHVQAVAARAQEFNPESLLRLMTSTREYTINGKWIC